MRPPRAPWCACRPQVLEALLRHSNFPNGRLAPAPKTLPSMAQLSATLAARMSSQWCRFLREVREKEERGELVEEAEQWLHEWVEGAGTREIVDRLALQLPALQLLCCALPALWRPSVACAALGRAPGLSPAVLASIDVAPAFLAATYRQPPQPTPAPAWFFVLRVYKIFLGST